VARRRPGGEVLLPVAIALVTITGAVLTYLSIRQESTAVDNDRLAVIQTVLVQSRETGAEAQTHAFGGLAAQYRAMLAQADAVEAEDPAAAQADRALAQSFATTALIRGFMSGAEASSTFDYAGQMQAALHNSDAVAPPENQPALTAATADRYHNRARWLAGSVVGMLVVVVLLMLARLSRARSRRLVLTAVSAVGYLAALALALPHTL
jgi:hypothetical protein